MHARRGSGLRRDACGDVTLGEYYNSIVITGKSYSNHQHHRPQILSHTHTHTYTQTHTLSGLRGLHIDFRVDRTLRALEGLGTQQARDLGIDSFRSTPSHHPTNCLNFPSPPRDGPYGGHAREQERTLDKSITSWYWPRACPSSRAKPSHSHTHTHARPVHHLRTTARHSASNLVLPILAAAEMVVVAKAKSITDGK